MLEPRKARRGEGKGGEGNSCDVLTPMTRPCRLAMSMYRGTKPRSSRTTVKAPMTIVGAWMPRLYAAWEFQISDDALLISNFDIAVEQRDIYTFKPRTKRNSSTPRTTAHVPVQIVARSVVHL